MTLAKADIVEKVYTAHVSMTKVQAVEAVEAILRLSKNTLINGSELMLSGFGKFNIRDKSLAGDETQRPAMISLSKREGLSRSSHQENCEKKLTQVLDSLQDV